jgi:hypothetical protein
MIIKKGITSLLTQRRILIMSIYSLWNPENDEAIFSPGDQKPFSTLTPLDSDKHTTDKTLEYDIHGTVLNEI